MGDGWFIVIGELSLVMSSPQQVIEQTLTQALQNANFVNVTYPPFPMDLDVRQKRVLYHVVGWLLSSAQTRVKRDRRLYEAFVPFVNRHKYGSAEGFRTSHTDYEYRGLEVVVEERNMQREGRSLIFPSIPFFRFGLAVEVGYRASLENPALLATYQGDLPAEIL